jgi:hypothetical protein
LRIEDGAYYNLDEVGAAVWGLCDGSRSDDQIATEIVDAFDAPKATVRGDVQEFIGELLSERLLERR